MIKPPAPPPPPPPPPPPFFLPTTSFERPGPGECFLHVDAAQRSGLFSLFSFLFPQIVDGSRTEKLFPPPLFKEGRQWSRPLSVAIFCEPPAYRPPRSPPPPPSFSSGRNRLTKKKNLVLPSPDFLPFSSPTRLKPQRHKKPHRRSSPCFLRIEF